MMTLRVTTTKPRRCGSVSGYPLHSGTVTLRGATAEQVALADAAARTVAGAAVSVDASLSRWTVRQKPDPDARGGYRSWGGADHDCVATLTCYVANAVREALGLPTLDD